VQGSGQDFLQTQTLPEGTKDIGSSHGDALDEAQSLCVGEHRSLGLDGVFRGEKAAEAPDQSLEGDHIEGIGAAEDAENLGSGLAGFRIADVVGQLDVGGGGAVFVVAGYSTDIHAYSHSMYLRVYQEENYNSHAYQFLDLENRYVGKSMA